MAELTAVFGNYTEKLPLQNEEKMSKLRRIGALQCSLNKQPLTFWTSFDFCVSVITTVGWGYTYPATSLGKLFCMVYASFGVPLYIVVVGSNGAYISELAERLDTCWRAMSNCLSARSLMYLELVGKYVIVGILVAGFIFAYTLTVYSTSHGESTHEDENLKSWTWFESIYYALISLTTIGFGDYFMPSASQEHGFYNFVQAMALVVSIIFGFALFTYAFNAYAEASKEQMRLLRGRYEAMATKNAILAFAQIYANSELMFERSQRKMSNALEEFKTKRPLMFQQSGQQVMGLRRLVKTWRAGNEGEENEDEEAAQSSINEGNIPSVLDVRGSNEDELKEPSPIFTINTDHRKRYSATFTVNISDISFYEHGEGRSHRSSINSEISSFKSDC